MNGPQLVSVAGRRAALEAVRTGRATQLLVAAGSRATPGLRELLRAAGSGNVPVREVSREELGRLAADHRGVIAEVRAPEQLGERDMAGWPFDADALVVVLDGIGDPQNLGAAARSAEAAGAAMLVSRVHRSAPVTSAAIRASAGALIHLPHARVANVARALHRLQDVGFTVVGLDQHAETSVYGEPCPAGRLAVVVGSEGEGMARLTREACDLMVRLPMRGRVGSLNASASLAAVLFAYVVPSRRDGTAGR